MESPGCKEDDYGLLMRNELQSYEHLAPFPSAKHGWTFEITQRSHAAESVEESILLRLCWPLFSWEYFSLAAHYGYPIQRRVMFLNEESNSISIYNFLSGISSTGMG